ncbi:MAG: pyridoxal phosphate-dependent decarboxylase family protein [Boseongicola sp.]
MKQGRGLGADDQPLVHVAEYGRTFRQRDRPIHPSANADELRQTFAIPLPDEKRSGTDVIKQLIEAAEPGLVGNTDPNFFAWVMGSSDPVGVAADWLTSIWGQNAAIFQTSPAAAIAEEAVASWLIELLDLPRESSVGLVTGATMAAFVGLAAARSEVLARAGCDFEETGLQGAPLVRVFASDDAHTTNFAALRHLGFGEANIHRVPSDHQGIMHADPLAQAMQVSKGPKIVITQAGHINSGAFEDFEAISQLARQHNAWVHVDGAFGLWARVLPEKQYLTRGVELADSWSVDGHKWLQIPYDSGFAIVRHADAHKRAMDISAGYLNQSLGDGRNPTEFNPELSRRARGFAAWAVLQCLGRTGVKEIISQHCNATAHLAAELQDLHRLEIQNSVDLNQIVLGACKAHQTPESDRKILELSDILNRDYGVFVRQARWKDRVVLRLSVISQDSNCEHIRKLAKAIRTSWQQISVGQ